MKHRRFLVFSLSALTVAVVGAASTSPAGPEVPMRVPFENSARYRWLNKTVLETRLLDEMETLDCWEQRHTFGYGQPSESRGEMALTDAVVKSGARSIRLRTRTMGDRPGPQMGRPFGSTSVVREFPGEDWRAFNRVSFWVYPDLPGFHVVSLLAVLHNDGELKSPGPGRIGLNFLILNNQTWNQVVWEIPDLPRDRVTAIEFQYRQQGHEPGASDTVTFYIDHLELQRVETDHYEGWDVAPGRIAYSHTGYPTGALKTAISSDLSLSEFELIDRNTGEAVLRRSTRAAETPLGRYRLLDFSDVRRPGTYLLRAGGLTTVPFRIGSDVWMDTVWKSINYFFCQRCGFAVPGIHGVCHRDWLGIHGGKKIVINGGWHDAGDVCQGLANSSEAVYAMLSLAERLRSRGEHLALARRLMGEARWGLDYLLKNNFGDGFRILWATHDFWTNGIIGDIDDVTAEARNDPWHNFLVASSETIAYRLFRESDPHFARYCLETARHDWMHAVEGMQRQTDGDSSFYSAGESMLDRASAGVVASIELLRATGEARFADTAVKLARTILEFQQQDYFEELDIPLAGFFWDSPDHKHILHKHHLSQMQAPILGLVGLCEMLPDHPDWIRWYSGVVLYSEYQKTVAAYTQPYGMLPESLYRDDEYLRLPEEPLPQALGYAQATREDFREQVLNGVRVGPRFYLRRFPVWFNRRGNHGTILPQTKALAVAGHLRNDLDAVNLAEKQLEWIVGRNPFAQSTMTGEGYDFVPHYSALSGDIVGSLPVGIETLRNRDLPYWPVHNHMNTKETWVHPVSCWIWVMRDLAGPGRVQGKVDPGTTELLHFRDLLTGRTIPVRSDPVSGSYSADLPRGRYEVEHGRRRISLTLLPASTRELDLRRRGFLDFSIEHSSDGDRTLTIRVSATGAGEHRLTIRAQNVRFDVTERVLDLEEGATCNLAWEGKIGSPNAPWVVVLIPDDELARRREIVEIRRVSGLQRLDTGRLKLD